MQISLIQIDGDDILWTPEHMPMLLRQAAESDLVVFPEGMPFLNDEVPILHKDAIKTLSDVGNHVPESTFIAGGYVIEAKHTRNRVYLVNRGKVIDWYDKQIIWEGEHFEPGTAAKCFEWDGKKCIPLICADAGDDLTPRKVRMMLDALDKGAGPETPIVVCSYGAGLLTDYWQPALREWSQGCNAPVVICGISGTHGTATYKDKNKMVHPFGGGGSGGFWPSQRELQSGCRGIVTVNIESQTVKWKAIRKS
jgi:predicted amidohydrolase